METLSARERRSEPLRGLLDHTCREVIAPSIAQRNIAEKSGDGWARGPHSSALGKHGGRVGG